VIRWRRPRPDADDEIADVLGILEGCVWESDEELEEFLAD
jgi:hypothetical protein